ncbi:MAG: LuxR C-terminal-related transcriptional regulator [Acidimicrobiia bacterium]|nr:LuxR C-terminal-related transcriptional regulator [Acidimicrobiia bacterium]
MPPKAIEAGRLRLPPHRPNPLDRGGRGRAGRWALGDRLHRRRHEPARQHPAQPRTTDRHRPHPSRARGPRATGRGDLSTEQIVDELVVSMHTANHVRNILTKLGAHSKLEAVTIAAREGIIDFQEIG